MRATAHGNDIFGLAHLIVDLTQRRSHLVAERTSNDHDVRLARRSTRRDAETLHVITRHVHMNHVDRATGKAERHPPKRAGTRTLRTEEHTSELQSLMRNS